MFSDIIKKSGLQKLDENKLGEHVNLQVKTSLFMNVGYICMCVDYIHVCKHVYSLDVFYSQNVL